MGETTCRPIGERGSGSGGAMSSKPSRFWKTFAIPAVIALLTAAGLSAALLGDGWWDTLAWLAMGTAAMLSIRGLLVRRS
ncbi:hypothetical protein ALO68_100291 [Pseudomonas syringae pv. helianthi]|uniref:DUF4175 domain-containing protein n=2 Tax=Pseudomonas syringae group genomosp. 7 TaxID=251699 RepID=A0A0P9RST2_9PSED|nr:hypothetical protein ALO68_100291 [Pseudomonas syringae pv. helianthi]RMQ99715.1 hypothetical protein ALP93_100222 [Pseudomonas syringae pv. helianthi]